jgi:TPP-dependent pyruvate/acetoin dehydrogenase alpha subunit
VERARSGSGATLVEALTYRLGPHTTSDDPRRYRHAREEEVWRARDPLERVRRYLERAGAWDEGWQEEIEREDGARLEAAVEAAEALPPMGPEEIVESMFADMTPRLREQRRALLEGPGEA